MDLEPKFNLLGLVLHSHLYLRLYNAFIQYRTILTQAMTKYNKNITTIPPTCPLTLSNDPLREVAAVV